MFSVIIADNVSVAKYVIPLVIVQHLDFVMIHWIQWIPLNSF